RARRVRAAVLRAQEVPRDARREALTAVAGALDSGRRRRTGSRRRVREPYGGSMEIFDTYTKELVDLPLPRGPVRMYICGPTVYARAHIGNARPFVIAMWMRQWLKVTGYDVTFVHNITDVNDKIYAAAGDGSSAELASQATEWYLEDTEALGLGMPDQMPKVTQNVPVIVEYI